MRKFILLPIMLFSFSAFSQNIEPKPNPPRAVNDFAGLMSTSQQDALEQKLDAYNDSTSSAIVIITVNSLNGYDINDVSLAYLRGWGVGTKGKNNGVVILVSKGDRLAKIETGYGMEGVLPDITCKEIIDNQMVPYFKQGDYYNGLDKAVNAIIQAAAGEYKADRQSGQTKGPPVGAVIFLVILFILLVGFLRGGGGGGGSYMSRRGSRGFGGALPWFLAGNLLGGGGFGGGGGGFGGGGFGGGFGGFGGGSGGGGGASGGW
jgi:uncharacterized protein